MRHGQASNVADEGRRIKYQRLANTFQRHRRCRQKIRSLLHTKAVCFSAGALESQILYTTARSERLPAVWPQYAGGPRENKPIHVNRLRFMYSPPRRQQWRTTVAQKQPRVCAISRLHEPYPIRLQRLSRIVRQGGENTASFGRLKTRPALPYGRRILRCERCGS